MTNELLKEAIYAVALRDKLNQYPSGCFTQLYFNYIKNLDPKWDGTYIFYHFSLFFNSLFNSVKINYLRYN